MCGRYSVQNEKENKEIEEIVKEVERRLYGTPELDAMKTGEIFPTNIAPVCIGSPSAMREATLMKWGFPMWGGKKGVIINAKSETAASLKTFRDAVRERRCLIPASGYYEWMKHDDGTKIKHYITRPDGGAVYMAGLFSPYQPDEGATLRERYVIITMPATQEMQPIHERMPLILLTREAQESWLNDPAFAEDILKNPPQNALLAQPA